MTRLELVEMRKSGRLLAGKEALAEMHGMQRFTNMRDLLAALRKDVMLKWMCQHHAMELSDGEQAFGFEGVPEW